ncbi:hypothetical protein NEIMUCOT_05408 [Neisseria mucosa ATCC 25996]|uniref:Uncharacterized protein n=1 Tax=Neisseria mucosa (strain ATCC 25996 / DSM 4631 / NCTC 10774 / M26) TaxID=546266 RepID=D2ZXQ4_NEIM2|nr:hypothetical protein NEIMUCOT_05408 [Neisseria mucosa ATCC 25996]
MSDSRIRPTFSDDPGLRSSEKIETPDAWGKSSDFGFYGYDRVAKES